MDHQTPSSADRVNQLVFVVSVLATCWIGMMGMHELGHVVGAIITGGKVTCVVLHPLSISRTDVSPNPNPLVVVWSGPVLGCLLPLLVWRLIKRTGSATWTSIIAFYCGFCLVSNGGYISLGSFDAVGDCREMLQNGSPQWSLILFGLTAIICGFAVWHSLGSVQSLWRSPDFVSPKLAITTLTIAMLTVFVSVMTSGN